MDSIATALAALAAGRAIVVVDDEDRENEGDLVVAAEKITPDLVAFMMSECRGLICVPLAAEDADRLQLYPMAGHNSERMGTAFTVSVDAREAITTGICAADRARTI